MIKYAGYVNAEIGRVSISNHAESVRHRLEADCEEDLPKFTR